jgi:copper(I)-binding protein
MVYVVGERVRRAFARLTAGVCCSAGISLWGCGAETPVIELERPVLALPAGGAPAAVYLTVHNSSGMPLEVREVTVDGADSTALLAVTAHRMPAASAARGATTLLSPVAGVTIPERGTVRFAPGGYTIAVSGLQRPLARGDSVRITVRLANAWSRSGMARVVAYTDLDTALVAGVSAHATLDSLPTVTRGRSLYLGNGCAACHGLLGDGTGPVGRTLSPPPRDFRVATAFRNGADEASIAQTLATGIPNGGAMPLYAHLTLTERRALASYVISLRASSPAPDSNP